MGYTVIFLFICGIFHNILIRFAQRSFSKKLIINNNFKIGGQLCFELAKSIVFNKFYKKKKSN